MVCVHGLAITSNQLLKSLTRVFQMWRVQEDEKVVERSGMVSFGGVMESA